MPARRQSLVQDVETSFRPPVLIGACGSNMPWFCDARMPPAMKLHFSAFEVAAVNMAISQFEEPVRDGLGVTSLFGSRPSVSSPESKRLNNASQRAPKARRQ